MHPILCPQCQLACEISNCLDLTVILAYGGGRMQSQHFHHLHSEHITTF